MAIPRRLWDSCIVLGYLAGQKDIKTDCDQLIQQAERGELEIMVSTIVQAEVAYLFEQAPSVSDLKIIEEFFSRDYVITVAFDISLIKTVRQLIRGHKGLQPFDAILIATALQWQIPIIETTDNYLLSLNGKEGNPPLIICRPLYQGPAKLL